MFTTRLVHHQASSTGEAVKLLIELQDGLQVESVIMTYDTTGALIFKCTLASMVRRAY